MLSKALRLLQLNAKAAAKLPGTVFAAVATLSSSRIDIVSGFAGHDRSSLKFSQYGVSTKTLNLQRESDKITLFLQMGVFVALPLQIECFPLSFCKLSDFVALRLQIECFYDQNARF